jgi:hypothetical protein
MHELSLTATLVASNEKRLLSNNTHLKDRYSRTAQNNKL